ncbi:peptidase S8/S53 subtilisin kexin sedolisin [Mesorhizobium sp. CA6]|uniref:peptidase S8/S53 subtilisin kexin sedolisin n=1 Tax=Mesorhizobium sp. CA6 TaxID=588500 RepID=UPI001CC98F91|nr:peptidase S8/S53 subtilisin kexin sedolisin [Mesorhizobium sp. CA6]MBZ9765519.1 peptidase S8/S53 subtilisin kexin sedolisin [Mesorhizobium sp. CA6]
MAISGHGWELHVERLGIQQYGRQRRTYGAYQLFIDGHSVDGLAGNMCECIGPGDNDHPKNGKRIEAGTYPLWTQFGRYRTIGYSGGPDSMPGLRLEGTGKRTGILIHPGHPPTLYLSSIGCLNPTAPLTSSQSMAFQDSRARVVALIDNLRGFAPSAFLHETMTHIVGASVVIDGETTTPLQDHLEIAFTVAADKQPSSLPISQNAAIQCARWLVDNFGDQLRAAVAGKPYRVKHLCAIVCQETAYKWLKWTATQPVQTILERCVFDASGDYPGTSRSAFPKNTAAFRARYGDAFTDMLIQEANLTRRLQGWSNAQWVYKGYGLFQYDLQNVVGDRDFFENKRWYSFDACLTKCCDELEEKLQASGGDLWDAIRRYNGSGASAEQYMRNVQAFTGYCAAVTGD